MLLVLFKKFLGRRQSHHSESQVSDADTPEMKIERIQKGDLVLRNQFLTDYQPYVAKLTSRFCKRYVDPARDDEYSIALTAFNEAVSQYSAQAGRSFFPFAETVVRRRLIDYVRKEQRFDRQVPYSSFEVTDDEDQPMNPLDAYEALERFDKDKVVEDRRNEILDFNVMLRQFDMSMADLAEVSPKHADSRALLFTIGQTLARDQAMMAILQAKKMLPIKELLEKVQVSRKTIERNRKYIIAIALIYCGPYPFLQDYLHNSGNTEERRGEHHA